MSFILRNVIVKHGSVDNILNIIGLLFYKLLHIYTLLIGKIPKDLHFNCNN